MPNWVFNTLSVTGNQLELDKFQEFISAPYETRHPITEYNHETKKWEIVKQDKQMCKGAFLFWNIKSPEPEILDSYYGSNDVGNKDPNHWYSWNLANWGTKWEASDSEIERSEGFDLYRFNTAWAQPSLDLISEMSDKFPTLNFHLEYEEEQGWGGEVELDNGVISSQYEYGIPNSHADYEAQGKQDNCTCSWDDDPENWFDDCPPSSSEIENQQMSGDRCMLTPNTTDKEIK